MSDNRDPRTHAVIGAAMEVHNVLGRGFLEHVYQSAMAVELAAREIPCRREADLHIWYKGGILDCRYRADFICFDEVIVELKALDRLGNPEMAQMLNYLKATRLGVGVLINFGGPRLEFQRVVMSNDPQMHTDGRR
ncbi:MAG: GxxExxY protein [Candidatus Promineofilum sp.]|nr:GxxExxY protein [Promineifilum sp.]